MEKYFLTFISMLLTAQLFSQDVAKQDYVIGEKHTVKSTILEADREVFIYLPDSYHDNDYTKYPVLYLLDGKKFFHAFTGAVAQMSSDASPQIPEMIVVAIVSQDRIRDSSPTRSLIGYRGKEEKWFEVSGGAGRFIEFIEKELVPYVGETYRSNGHRIFTGYSFTGLPVLHALFTKPGLFNAFLAIDFSAWWDEEVTLKHMYSFFEKYEGTYKDVFISTVDRVDNVVYPEKENKTWKFIKRFEQNHPENIGLGYKKYAYKQENHHTMPLISFMDGLKYLFRGHMIHYDEMFTSPTKIKTKFEQLSNRIGWDIRPREGLINHFGYQFLYEHSDAEKALFYFRYNTENYPNSHEAWYSLGKAYEETGNKKAAIDCYKQSLKLSPTNKELSKKLKALTKN